MPGASFVDLERDPLDPSAVSILPLDVWRRLRAVGVSKTGSTLVVAMADPDDEAAVRELGVRTGLRIFATQAEESTILDALERSHEDG